MNDNKSLRDYFMSLFINLEMQEENAVEQNSREHCLDRISL